MLGLAAELLYGLRTLAASLRALGLAAGAPIALAGLAALTIGTRYRRPLAVVGLAAVGALASLLVRGLLGAHLGLSPLPAAVVLTVAGAGAGLAVPAAFPFAVAALPGAVMGHELPLGGRAELGAAVGALVAGLLGLFLARIVTAVAASLAGAVALALGLLACFPANPLLRELAARPAAVAGFALVVGIAGAALQLSRPPATSPAAPAARSPESRL